MSTLSKLFRSPQNIVLLINVVIVILLIYTFHFFVIDLGEFVFATLIIVSVVLAVVRPRWLFWLFVGMLPLEIINLAPTEFPFALRPYQLFGFFALLGYLLAALRKLNGFRMPKIIITDWLLLALVVSGLLSAFFAPVFATSFMQAIIVTSFFALYVCTRLYVQTRNDLGVLVPFFLSSSLIVVAYGIYQNWCFAQGCAHNEIMPGRPNATFAEADWFALYCVFVIAALYALLFYLKRVMRAVRRGSGSSLAGFSRFFVTRELRLSLAVYLSLIVLYIGLVVSVARSAWIGAVVVFVLFAIILIIRYHIHAFLQFLLVTVLSLGVVYLIITHFSLTTFNITDRAQSTGGLQEITVACTAQVSVQALMQLEQIESVQQLEQFDCWHIDLEEIAHEESMGHMITTVKRDDPNVSIRKDIYAQSFALAKEHWLFGIGWGSSAYYLGNDENGTALNASNVFLAVWLSAGIVGLLSFVAFLTVALYQAVRALTVKNEDVTVSVMVILGLSAILIPNLFNAGLLLGFIWVFFGVISRKDND